ncbi:hypothetical protein CR513_41602, partial [Mucuna pruriens]
MHPFQKSGFVARISSRITTVIRVVDTIKQTITDLMSHSQINQVAFVNDSARGVGAADADGRQDLGQG